MTTSRPPLPQTTASTAAPLLDIAQLTMRFGGIVALENVSFTVRQGRIAVISATLFTLLLEFLQVGQRALQTLHPLAGAAPPGRLLPFAGRAGLLLLKLPQMRNLPGSVVR